jgi:hypothetical protein
VTLRRAIVVAVLALVTLVLHLVLVRAMAHGHVAHVLLGAGNAAPPLGAAGLAVTLVVVRLGAVVVVPGALLAAAASLVAHVLVGPPRGGGAPGSPTERAQRAPREGAGAGVGVVVTDGSGSGTRSGTATKPGGSGSRSSAVAVAMVRGISIDGRGTP